MAQVPSCLTCHDTGYVCSECGEADGQCRCEDGPAGRILLEEDSVRALLSRLLGQQTWQPIDGAPELPMDWVLVALIREGVIWRVSEAKFNGLGWYDRGGKACHWRTHFLPLPPPPAPSGGPQ